MHRQRPRQFLSKHQIFSTSQSPTPRPPRTDGKKQREAAGRAAASLEGAPVLAVAATGPLPNPAGERRFFSEEWAPAFNSRTAHLRSTCSVAVRG